MWLISRTTSYPGENQKFSSIIIFISQLRRYGIRQMWLISRTTSYPGYSTEENQKFSYAIIFISQLRIYRIMSDVAYISYNIVSRVFYRRKSKVQFLF